MFDRAKLERLIALHEKAYRLFAWLNRSLKGGKRPLATVAPALAFAEAAAEWLKANRSNIPEAVRPDPGDMPDFPHLFVSFLATSFEIADRSAFRACPGCWCCIYWVDSKHLRARNPDRKARLQARRLKMLYLSGAGVKDAESFYARNRDLWPAITLATYVSELDRRSKFASQGEGSLALWRELAWEPGGGPKKKFKLKAEAILKAETAIIARVRTAPS